MTTTSALPMLLAEVEVADVSRLTPTFLRVELTAPELADLGVDGPFYDQRIKLIFPDPGTGSITSVAGADESWLGTWMARPVQERGHMRTYTVRDVRGEGPDTRLVVDIVLHLEGGAVGPGSLWASQAAPGDRLVLLAPRRGHDFGGIEFAPAPGADLLLVGDETAVPAICAVLEQLPRSASGSVFMEVPVAQDFLDVAHPPGVSVTWLARDDEPLGQRLHREVVAHLGMPGPAIEVAPEDVDPDLWETPTWSSSGEALEGAEGRDTATALASDPPGEAGAALAGLYAWIAGESSMVTGLRRHLVRELGLDRRQVAFMGYWRRGVAMRS